MASEPARKRAHKTARAELSVREVRFCQAWAQHRNGVRAYKEAGFEPSDDNVAHVLAHRLLRKVTVRKLIRDIEDAAAEAAKVTAEQLARGFRGAEQANVTDLLGPDGEMLPPSQWPKSVSRHITRIEVEELTETVPDPDNPRRKKKVAVGTKWKVWLENKTECRKVLAQWKRMLGQDKADAGGKPDPLVIGGADLEKL